MGERGRVGMGFVHVEIPLEREGTPEAALAFIREIGTLPVGLPMQLFSTMALLTFVRFIPG
jgi:hypothetical protein